MACRRSRAANAASDLRRALRTFAEQVTERYPDFGETFDRTLNGKMIADSSVPGVAA